MDLKIYYHKVREAESKITEPFTLVVSRETPDGGKGGVVTEVARALAAKMTVEGTAELANQQQAQAFLTQRAEAILQAEQAALASKVQLAVMSTDELNRLKGVSQPSKA